MAPPRTVSPTEALDILAQHLRRPADCEVDVDEAVGRVLATEVDSQRPGSAFPGEPAEWVRAAVDGYAVASPVEAGDELRVVAGAHVAADEIKDPPGAGRAVRVECGARLAAGLHAVVPVSWTTAVAGGIVRVERAPRPGSGLSGPPAGEPRGWPAGTVIDHRLRVFLEAAGHRRLAVYRTPRIGVLVVGDELSEAAGAARRDLVGVWLAPEIEDLGPEVVPLGIVGDSPTAIGKAIVRARERRLEALVIAGGLGVGLYDRTVEAIHDWNSRIFFERLAVPECPSLLFAKLGGMDILGTSGMPLAAAMGFDLFVAPALAILQGREPRAWDWRRQRPPILGDVGVQGASEGEREPREWHIVAARLRRASPGGPPLLETWVPESGFSPAVGSAEGWAVWDPAEPALAFFRSRSRPIF